MLISIIGLVDGRTDILTSAADAIQVRFLNSGNLPSSAQPGFEVREATKSISHDCVTIHIAVI